MGPLHQVGDKVTKPRSESVLEIAHVSKDGDEVNLQLPGTNVKWFRVKTDTLAFLERKPPARTSNPFTHPDPVLDSGEILKRICTVQEENLKRIDDDIDILKAYLKTQHEPKAAISALEGLTIEQHVSWKKAVEKIEELLGSKLPAVANGRLFCHATRRHNPADREAGSRRDRH